MIYRITYFNAVLKDDVPRLSRQVLITMQRAIEAKLRTEPELYGKPLRRSLKGSRKVRVGDYRIVFRLEKRTVIVIAMRHRKDVYDLAQKRTE